MNILMFYPGGFEPRNGGTEKVMETLSRCFSHDGHKIFYVSVHNDTGYNPPYPYLVLDLGMGKYLFSERLKRFLEFVDKYKIDLIIDHYHHNYTKYIELVSEVRKRRGIKCVNLYHLSPDAHVRYWKSMGEPLILDLKVRKKFKERLPFLRNLKANISSNMTGKALRLRLKGYDRVVLLSEKYIPQAMEFTGGDNAEKLCAIHNSVVAPESKEKTEKENVILWVGRMARIKHPEKAVKIWMDIKDDFPDWRLKFLGGGELIDAVEELVKGNNIDRCEILNYQIPDPYYQKAKIIMMTSDLEGLPLVLIEAQRYGVVPIVFNTFDSLDDIVNQGKCGISVPKDDIDAYEKALRQLMSEGTVLNQMSENARLLSDSYMEKNIIPQWYELFRELGLRVETPENKTI